MSKYSTQHLLYKDFCFHIHTVHLDIIKVLFTNGCTSVLS